jgi:hypothetical protein
VLECEGGIFEEVEEFCADGCARDGRDDYAAAGWCFEEVAGACALGEVDAEGDRVGEGLEDEMPAQILILSTNFGNAFWFIV